MDYNVFPQPTVQEGSQKHYHNDISGSAQAHLGDHIGDIHHHHHAPSVERTETPPAPISTVPFRRDADFIDRGTLLTQVEQKCAEEAARVALVGIGGVGKSQLAIEYCHRLRRRSPNTWVFWIHASNAERIAQSFLEIAEEAKIPGRRDPQTNIFELVKKWLRSEKRRWLLVLDNLDDDSVLTLSQELGGNGVSRTSKRRPRSLLDYLPHCPNGALLFSTRTMSVANKLVEFQDTIQVNPMTDTEAVILLSKKLNISSRDKDLQELAALLEFMPLAIVQAATYIQKRAPRYSVRGYIDEFNQNDQARTGLLSHEAGHLRRDHGARNSIIVTWQISFDYIRSRWPSTTDLLSLMSFFDRQGIPEYVLTDKCEQSEHNVGTEQDEEDGSTGSDRETFEMDLERLRDFSFVSVELDGHTFSMHRLVQLATREWLVHHGQDKEWRTLFLKKLDVNFPNGEYENWARCEALLPHVTAAEAQRPDPAGNSKSVENWARILRNASWYLNARGKLADSERVCGKSIVALEDDPDHDAKEILASRGMLATIYKAQGHFKEAEALEMQILETSKRVLGEEYPDTLISMNRLASLLRELGKYNEAEKLQREVLATRQRVLGEEDPYTLTSASNLALVYCDLGRYEEAGRLQRRLLEIDRRVLGEEHPSTLANMSNLAITYCKLGRFKEAGRLQRKVLEMDKRILGEEHPSTLNSMYNLAFTLDDRGHSEEAVALMATCQRLSVKTLGPAHPFTRDASDSLKNWRKQPVRQARVRSPSPVTRWDRLRSRARRVLSNSRL